MALCLGGAAGLLLAACAGAPGPAASATPAVQASATLPAATPTSRPSSTPAFTDTPASTATVAPTLPPSAAATATATPDPTSTATATTAATATAAPSSPTTTASATSRPTRLPTKVPVTLAPLGPPETAPLMSTTGGPAGYASRIQCQRAGADCTPVMRPGELNFSLSLAGDKAAPWTHFIDYGLSVEKDGANVAGLFMFVDAGWLQPGTVVGYGASREFSQPGTYVIRSSGCLTTDLKSTNCAWATIAGDVVTFKIQ